MSIERIDNLLIERGRLVAEMRSLLDAHPDGLGSEDKVKYERLDARQKECKAQADLLTSQMELDADMAAPVRAGVRPSPEPQPSVHVKPRNSVEYKKAIDGYLRTGRVSNALEVGTSAEGGYLTHDEFNAEVWKIREKFNALRGLCRVISTSGDHNIRYEASTGTASWVDEEGSYSASDPSFGNVTLNAHKLTRLVLVSEELLQDSDFDIFAYLAEEYGRSFARAEEAAFIDGDASLKPTGMITGAGSVTRTESPLGAAITASTLLDLFYGLGEVYRNDAHWIFNDATVRVIRGLTDQNDNFVWQPGLQLGQPDRVLGRPYLTSEHMPVAAESPLSAVALFGDLSNYVIADRTSFNIQRLNELYAATGQVGFRAWSRVDGKTVMSAGLKKVVF